MTQLPNWVQGTLEEILHDLLQTSVKAYISNIGCLTQATHIIPWLAYIQLINKVLTRLQDNGFAVNPSKCAWVIQETDWLGYKITPKGIKL